MSSPDIQSLIERAQQGDETAVSRLYQRHAQAIYRYIFYRVPTENDAEDITAEVFLKMVEGLPKYQITGAPFETWLYRIAAARIADFYRRRNRETEVELTETLSSSEPTPEEHLQQAREIEQLRAALNQLNQEQQTVLVLRFLERKSHDDVAAIIGKSTVAVRSIQHRALNQLAEILGSETKVRHYLRGRHE